jgi:hypothetical protein
LGSAIGQSVSDNVGTSLNGLSTQIANGIAGSEPIQQASINLSAKVAAKQVISDAEFETAIINSQNAGAQRASNFVSQSDAYFRQGNVMASRHLQQMQGIQETISNSFANGQARGEASYLNGVNNRAPIGVDILEGVDVAGNIAFGEQRTKAFDSLYSDLSFNEKQLFNSGVNLFGAVIDYGNTIGDSAKYLLDISGLHGEQAQLSNINDVKQRVSDFGFVASQLPSVISGDGAVRGSFAYQAPTKRYEGKAIIGSDLMALQGKSPLLGSNVTDIFADSLGVDFGGFKSDNLNVSYRGAFDYEIGGRTDIILETDIVKNKLPIFGFGDFKYSFGFRTTLDGVTVPAANIGFQPRGSQFTGSIEFRGNSVSESLSELNNRFKNR